MSYKHKYYKYKQKYMNLLYGGGNRIKIIHKVTGEQLDKLPFLRDAIYANSNIIRLPLFISLQPHEKQQISELLGRVQNESIINDIIRQINELTEKYDAEKGKDKENIDMNKLANMKKEYKLLLQQKQNAENENKTISDQILKLLLGFFIATYYINIDDIYNYDFESYLPMGGQGIVFRIIMRDTQKHHIIKFTVSNNCREIEHEALIMPEYIREYGMPTTFTPYQPLFYDIGRDVSSGSDSICFLVYDNVGNENLHAFVKRCNSLIESGDSGSQELYDRIMMIPHILLQIAMQLEYYKHYRHNDIRLENIVVDVYHNAHPTPLPLVMPIYRGTVVTLYRVTIVDFGMFKDPIHVDNSLIFMISPEVLEQKFIIRDAAQIIDNKNSDLVGFFWVAIDLLTCKRLGIDLIDQLILRVLSNEQNIFVITGKKNTTLIEHYHQQKTLLFIYQLLMHNSNPSKYHISDMFSKILIDSGITFDALFNMISKKNNRKILEILFSNDMNKYNKVIRDLFSLLTPISIRPSISNIIKWLRKIFPKVSVP